MGWIGQPIPILSPKRICLFWAKVQRKSDQECWPWLACSNGKGYGQFGVGKGQRPAHRVAWYLTKGVIPPGLFVLHRCDNPACCNPRHLWLGTQADNLEDMTKKGRRVMPTGKNHPRGEKHPCAKLNKTDIFQIRKLAKENYTQRVIAAQYRIDQSTVSDIITRKTWAQIT